jgi:hypothetical protein
VQHPAVGVSHLRQPAVVDGGAGGGEARADPKGAS